MWSYVMQSTFPTERMRSIISMVSISLSVVVIDAIVGVVIVVASIRVVVVVMIIRIVIVDGGVSHIIKLSFVIIVFLLGLSAFSMATTCASRAVATPSVLSCQMIASIMASVADVDVLLAQWKEFKTSRDRYGNNGMRVSVSLGEICFEGNKSWESNIGDSDNTGDGGKIAGREITTWGGGMTSYACMTSIFKSSCKGKKTSMSKRYLVKSFEESGEMLPGDAEKQFNMFVEEKVFLISKSDGTIVE
nr:hypothetical protein [Tanacetum cinerariifolium]